MYKAQINFDGPKEEISVLYEYFIDFLFVYDSGCCKCFQKLHVLSISRNKDKTDEMFKLYIVSDNIAFIKGINELSIFYPLVNINICLTLEPKKKFYSWNVIFGQIIKNEYRFSYGFNYKYKRDLKKIYKNIGSNTSILLKFLIKDLNKDYTKNIVENSSETNTESSDEVENEEEFDI